MNKSVLLLFFLLPLLALSKKTYTIEIVVADIFTSEPIRGAQIYLNGKTNDEMVTDELGLFFATKCIEEEVDIIIKHPSYREEIEFLYNRKRRHDRIVTAKLIPSVESMNAFFTNLSIEEFKRAKEEASKIDTLLIHPCDSSDWKTGTSAMFPGGIEILQQFITVHIHYPAESYEMADQGKVLLSFFIEKDGSLSQIRVERGVTKELDREAKRVIRASPNWVPGYCNGRAARTKFVIPIVFSLQ
ncbi:MAG: TonB family protein [Crocinitomicaceae bacterium]|jgi:TonB family protein